MSLQFQSDFNQRFRRRVLLPGAVILLITALLCGGVLVAAGRGTDTMSLLGQQSEIYRAIAAGLDDLTLAQESVGLCDACIREAGSTDSDQAWLDENIGFRLFDLHNVNETYILNGQDRPIYASVERERARPEAFERVAPAVKRFVALARGEIQRPSGRGNLNERLPNTPLKPIIMPPVPGFSSEPMVLYPSLKTTPSVLHATDLVRIGNRVAFVSVMQMARVRSDHARPAAPPPVLVNLRYMDDHFLKQISKLNYLTAARVSDSPVAREGEVSLQLVNSDGLLVDSSALPAFGGTNVVSENAAPMGTMFWKPAGAGAAMTGMLLLPAAIVFGVIALLVLLMALRMRRLMKRDNEQLRELEQAHLELKAKEAQAHHLAYHDVLTGLPNRALFNDNADQALIRARHGEPAAILLLDLDRFKNVNDRFGHLAGDALIQEVAGRLLRVLDRPDAVARLGGDEFAVLLQQEDLAGGIEHTLDRILEELRRPFEILGNQAHVGVSIGVALAPEYGTDRTDLMRKADIALYRAKDEGRDCYRFFTESMDETVQLRAVLEADLRAALAGGEELSVHYQPLVDSDGRKVTGLEALLRWQHPVRGWIGPHLFVPVAEETGLISQLGDWVLGEACQVAREWPNLTIAVNLSPIQFCDEGFAERICTLVRAAGISPHQIELEVTEGVVLDQNETVRGALKRLRAEGFRIALDDFGTGYSSLSYLRDFEVDKIKIDKSFIQSLGQTMDAAAIVTAVVTLGHAMGLQVTAEGVETADQETFLRSAGCSQLQGFLFSRAVPADRLRDAMGDRGWGEEEAA
jgi:diguanylate cyclase (GGDEF)-like protein